MLSQFESAVQGVAFPGEYGFEYVLPRTKIAPAGALEREYAATAEKELG